MKTKYRLEHKIIHNYNIEIERWILTCGCHEKNNENKTKLKSMTY